MLNYDRFGQKFSMRIDKGRDAVPSKMGTFCSFLLLVILLLYLGYKISVLESRNKIDIFQAVKENHYDSSFVFGPE